MKKLIPFVLVLAACGSPDQALFSASASPPAVAPQEPTTGPSAKLPTQAAGGEVSSLVQPPEPAPDAGGGGVPATTETTRERSAGAPPPPDQDAGVVRPPTPRSGSGGISSAGAGGTGGASAGGRSSGTGGAFPFGGASGAGTGGAPSVPPAAGGAGGLPATYLCPATYQAACSMGAHCGDTVALECLGETKSFKCDCQANGKVCVPATPGSSAYAACTGYAVVCGVVGDGSAPLPGCQFNAAQNVWCCA